MTDNVTDVDLFAAPAPTAPQVPAEISVNELVGEGKKYKTPDELAKAKIHADRHIETLEQTLEALRADLNTRITLEEFMTKVSSKDGAPQVVEPSASNVVPPANTDALTPEKVLELVRAEEAKKARAANTEFVKQELTKKYGGDYLNSLNAKTAELGLTPKQVQEMAATAPKALLALFDKPAPAPTAPVAPPRNAINSAAQPPLSNERDAAYYKNLLKTDPRKYWSRDVQIQMHDDALRLGDNFHKRK
jgi:hypothetical protein